MATRMLAGGAVTRPDREGEAFVLWPHRSLGRKGTVVLLAVVAAGLSVPAAFVAGAASWLILIPAGATLAGLAVALRANFRSARAGEIIRVGPEVLCVERFAPSGVRLVAEFSTYWVRICLDSDHYTEHRLTLREGRRCCTIGAFLAPEERMALAKALRRSISVDPAP